MTVMMLHGAFQPMMHPSSREVQVSYTIRSRGQPIGSTVLNFVRIPGPLRSGWFVPSPEGERVMPVITAMHAALQQQAMAGDEGVEPAPVAELAGGSPYADVLEAMHHVDALDLTLHHPDGTLVPTRMVAIQDTTALLGWIPIRDEPESPPRERYQVFVLLESPVAIERSAPASAAIS